MPIENPAMQGTEADGSLHPDYCIYCYRDGAFVHPMMTLEEMKQKVEGEMRKRDMDQHLINLALNSLPYFRRWHKRDLVM